VSAPTWDAVEAALVAWVRAATGLGADAVYLGNQNVTSRFPGPMAVVTVGTLLSVGADDELRWDFDAGRPAGAEVVFKTNGWRTCTCTVAFLAPGTTGSGTARGLAIQAQAALRLPSARTALNTAGVGVWSEGDVRWVPLVDSGQWFGQAVLEVALVLKAEASEATGYISTYEATGTVSP
jgi:hypothetical protein